MPPRVLSLWGQNPAGATFFMFSRPSSKVSESFALSLQTVHMVVLQLTMGKYLIIRDVINTPQTIKILKIIYDTTGCFQATKIYG